MANPKHSIEKLLTIAHVALTNMHNDAPLRATLAVYGCTDDRLAQGQALHGRILALLQQQELAYGDLATASAALKTSLTQAEEHYRSCFKVARVAFEKDPGALHKLNLNTARKKSRAGWLRQAQQFYTNALVDDAILSRLSRFDVTEERLERGKRQIEALGAHSAARHHHRGTAQLATKTRDEALAELEEWMREFRQIARLALKNQPQSLEKLGLATRS